MPVDDAVEEKDPVNGQAALDKCLELKKLAVARKVDAFKKLNEAKADAKKARIDSRAAMKEAKKSKKGGEKMDDMEDSESEMDVMDA